jgi:hypothetical protein
MAAISSCDPTMQKDAWQRGASMYGGRSRGTTYTLLASRSPNSHLFGVVSHARMWFPLIRDAEFSNTKLTLDRQPALGFALERSVSRNGHWSTPLTNRGTKHETR